MSGSGGGCARRRPLRQPPVVDDDDVGCSCPKQRLLLRSLLSSLVSRARGALGSTTTAASRPKSATSSSWASISTTAAAFTSTSTTGASATTVNSSVDSWGPATYEARQQRRKRRQRRRRVAREEEETAVAVEVVSAAPYEDFRESMVAMVVEKEMYAWEELNALLHQFLTLNSPRHHALILHAFADLWAPRSGLFCPPSPCLAL
uniref:Transcription repressor n=1 Tax=Leersia perrieri TaxID=77586 RepID=A0A0D9WH15_9ORYZ